MNQHLPIAQLIRSILLVALTSCVTTNRTTSPKTKSSKSISKGDRLDNNNLVDPQGSSGSQKKLTNPSAKSQLRQQKRRAHPVGKNDLNKRTNVCHGLMEKIHDPIATLAKSFPVARIKMNPTTQSALILKANQSDCKSEEKQMDLIKNLVKAVEIHSERIGVLLPLSGPESYSANLILEGMKTYARFQGVDFSKFIVRDTAGNSKLTEEAISELIFNDEVSAFIGGFTQAEKAPLEMWSEKLLVPTLILAPIDSPEKVRSSQIFNVFPNEQELADLIVKTSQTKKFRSLALLYPVGGSDFISKVKQSMSTAGLRLAAQASYVHGNYQSMEKAAQTIFQVLPHQRRAELAALIRKEKVKAEKDGYGFNPDMVFLPPSIPFEGVVIPDDFKTIRHFAQIFKFLSVEKEKLTMIGHQQWRSQGLIQPYDEFMEKSFFVDFIGSYRKLPSGISARTIDGEYFVSANNARRYDFNLIGYHASSIIVRALSKTKTGRRKIAGILQSLEYKGEDYFGSGRVFSENHMTRWPAFAFEIINKKIKLIDSVRDPSPAH